MILRQNGAGAKGAAVFAAAEVYLFRRAECSNFQPTPASRIGEPRRAYLRAKRVCGLASAGTAKTKKPAIISSQL